jgi:hypothetical protein
MDLTGHSTDFIVDASFPQAMRRLVRRGQQRWPGLFLYGEPLPPGAATDWHLPEAADDHYSGIVTFSSGQRRSRGGRRRHGTSSVRVLRRQPGHARGARHRSVLPRRR